MIHDVVVVGGGPVGCYIAGLLGRAGIDVQVFEEHDVIGEPVDCSGIIGAEAAARLSLEASLKFREIRSFVLVSPGGFEVVFEPESPLAFVVDRGAFDRWVARDLSRSGVAVHLGTHVTSLEAHENRVEIGIVDGPVQADQIPGRRSNRDATISASVVVLASGPRYRWQKKFGMGEPGRVVKTAQTEVAVRDLDDVRILLGSKVAPGSFAWQVPFRRNGEACARIGVSSRAPARPFLEGILRRLEAQGLVASSHGDIRSWVIPLGAITRSYADRVIAVGDAAGQTKPTTGGGLYYGLLCAEEAAATIVEAFEKGDFSARTLGRYESRWKTKIGSELRTGTYFRRLGERLTDRELDDVIRLLRTDGVLTTLRKKASFDWHRNVISFALRHPQLGRIFVRTLFR